MPSEATNVVAVAEGFSHDSLLNVNGTVYAGGWDGHHQVDVPADLTNVVSVKAGYYYSMALTANHGPVLSVALTDPRRENGDFTVFIPTQSGRVYALEYKESLADTNWTTLPLVAGTGRKVSLDDPQPRIQRFYRVRYW